MPTGCAASRPRAAMWGPAVRGVIESMNGARFVHDRLDYAQRDLTLTLRPGLIGTHDHALIVEITGSRPALRPDAPARGLVHDAGGACIAAPTLLVRGRCKGPKRPTGPSGPIWRPATLEKHSTGGLYLNFPGLGEDNEALVRAGYGVNYDRLTQLKAKYDRTNLFRMNLNIAPAT